MAAQAEELFAALADPTRWRVLSLLAERGEGTATTLAGELPVSRVAVVKHLAVLDRARLVESRRRGREVRYTVRPERLTATARHLAAIAHEWDQRLAAIKRLAEEGGGASLPGELSERPSSSPMSLPGSSPSTGVTGSSR